eukprot:Sdes_comp15840_c0_seq1m4924
MISKYHLASRKEHPRRKKASFRSCLVTGACGFVGSYVVDYLLNSPSIHRILALDTHPSSLASLPLDLENSKLKFFQGSILDQNLIQSIFSEEIDCVIHTAACLRATREETYEKVNFEGTKLLLDICLQKNVKSFCYVSSFSVCWDGWTSHIAQNETLPYLPSFYDKYAQSKYKAELLVRSQHRANNR